MQWWELEWYITSCFSLITFSFCLWNASWSTGTFKTMSVHLVIFLCVNLMSVPRLLSLSLCHQNLIITCPAFFFWYSVSLTLRFKENRLRYAALWMSLKITLSWILGAKNYEREKEIKELSSFNFFEDLIIVDIRWTHHTTLHVLKSSFLSLKIPLVFL